MHKMYIFDYCMIECVHKIEQAIVSSKYIYILNNEWCSDNSHKI